jgi:hypothetical protein
MNMVLIYVFVIAALPFVVYVCVKVGTVAFFRGRQSFHETFEGKEDNGQED